MAFCNEIRRRGGAPSGVEGVDNNQLCLHFFRDQALDVDARVLADCDALARLRQSGEVRRKLYKYAVVLDRPDDARNSFAGRKQSRVFAPGSKQLLVCERNTPIRLDRLDDGFDILRGCEPVARMCDAADGDCVDGDQGRQAAADINETAKRFQVRNLRVYDIARHKL